MIGTRLWRRVRLPGVVHAILVAIIGAALPASAQTAASALPTLELGAVVSRTSGGWPLGLGGRITVRGQRRVALEASLDWTEALRGERRVDQVMWFYAWQVRHALWRDAASTLFATYGTAGWVSREQDRTDRDRFAPQLVLPVLPLIGLGAQRLLHERLALRGDAQLVIWPFSDGSSAFRLSGGVSIPIGM